jgi:hypothetical protein
MTPRLFSPDPGAIFASILRSSIAKEGLSKEFGFPAVNKREGVTSMQHVEPTLLVDRWELLNPFDDL